MFENKIEGQKQRIQPNFRYHSKKYRKLRVTDILRYYITVSYQIILLIARDKCNMPRQLPILAHYILKESV